MSHQSLPKILHHRNSYSSSLRHLFTLSPLVSLGSYVYGRPTHCLSSGLEYRFPHTNLTSGAITLTSLGLTTPYPPRGRRTTPTSCHSSPRPEGGPLRNGPIGEFTLAALLRRRPDPTPTDTQT